MFELVIDVVPPVTESCNSLCLGLVIGAAAVLLSIVVVVTIVMYKRRKPRTNKSVVAWDPAATHTTVVIAVGNKAMTSYDGYCEITKSAEKPTLSTTCEYMNDPQYLELQDYGEYIHPPANAAPALAPL